MKRADLKIQFWSMPGKSPDGETLAQSMGRALKRHWPGRAVERVETRAPRGGGDAFEARVWLHPEAA